MNIKSFNIELTSRCNAKCSLCRHQYSREIDLSFEDISNFFNRSVLQKLTEIKLYGSLGDPTLHPQFKKIIKHFKDLSLDLNFNLNISTNGSMYNEFWWEDLGKMLSPTDVIFFGLDGSNKTHPIYRGTSFEKVFNNMKAFIKGGGSAKWMFLCFKHNQHEIGYLKKLSEEIGAEFAPRYSSEYNSVLEYPEIEISTEGGVSEHFESCCPLQNRQLYIGADGIISPCPFLRIFCNNILENGKGFFSEKEILINFYKNKDSLDIHKTNFNDLEENEYLKWVDDNFPNFTNCKMCGFK